MLRQTSLFFLFLFLFGCSSDSDSPEQEVIIIELPSVTTGSATNVTTNSVEVNGNVTNDGGGQVTARGFVWDTSSIPTLDKNKTTNGTGEGAFDATISNLEENSSYFIRAYATNSEGTVYGNEISFTTEPGAVALSTMDVTEVGETTAKGGGTITDTGGTTIIARGVCWSTEANPTIDDTKTEDGDGGGEFESTLSGLSPNTEYHVRAYATNSEGTVYGNEIAFTTLEGAPKIYEGDVILESQQEVDDFGNQGYIGITGSLLIGDTTVTGPWDASDISNLTPLSNLETIGSTFTIFFNPSLTSLEGLSNLTSIGGDLHVRFNDGLLHMDDLASLTQIEGELILNSNDAMTNLDGLSNLISLGGGIHILNNDLLTNIQGLSNLTVINGDIEINYNIALTSFAGFQSLTIVQGNFYINGSSLNNLSALDNLETIEGDLRIERLNSLEVLNGFNKLNSVFGDLRISDNISLINIQGFSNLNDVENILIENNHSLTEVNGFGTLTQINGGLELFANYSLAKIGAFQAITTIGGDVELSWNHLQGLDFISNLTVIGGTFKIESEKFLYTLDELGSLATIGGNLIMNRSDLFTVYFEGLTQIGGSLMVTYNNSLFRLDLPNLNSVEGNVEIRWNTSGSFDFQYEWGLTSIGGDLIIESNFSNVSLTGLFSIHAFENVNTIGGDVEITGNGYLRDLCGLRTLFLNGFTNGYLVENNYFNPTQQNIIDGYCW